ncbi:centrosomal protein of 85 kDa-like isoform X2 [Homarus americanus]|uniref:centrosomal protein of 85 kDa-like isoform X2 n=1 Tax=Homarus americanus TaxID=6706 RepID=UPI001C450B95|nr:centrosomal protein of 85 kDa-like isoform X2 [Homarus americanus]
MEPADAGVWRVLRRSRHRQGGYKQETSLPVGNEISGRVPAALVHPFPPGEKGEKLGNKNFTPNFIHRLEHSPTNFPSPYLLSAQTTSPLTPVCGLVRAPPSITLNLDGMVNCSSNSQDMELQSLRYQVQEIHNKLNGDIKGNSEYQQLLSEKRNLEETLGSTEYALQQLKTTYNGLRNSASASEQEFLQKLEDIQEKYRLLNERHCTASDQLTRLKDYLRDLPTLSEHQNLQQEILQKCAQVSLLSSKVDYLSEQMKKLVKKENEQAATIHTLTQQRDDLSLKLDLSENLLKELESQRATASEEGHPSKEDLLWTSNQLKKELESAKKLLNYRKQKVESLHKDFLAQDKMYAEKLEAEQEQGEKLKETVWQLERDLEQYKIKEEKMISKLTNAEQKQKKTEERLEMALGQVASQCQMSSVMDSMLSNLHIAVHQLKDLVTISQQISEGHSPDISLLLNFSEDSESVTTEGLTTRLKEVRGLIQQLEDVRTHLQEKYTHHLAKNITCAQM